MRKTSSKQIAALLAVAGPVRFRHFVKRVVDYELAWGLWSDGWALMADSDERTVFPLWPAHEYADLCATDTLAGYVAREIPLDRLLNEVLPTLSAEGTPLGIFPIPSGNGVIVCAQQLESALRQEINNYYSD
jgi:hypothetical protein